MRRFLAFTIVMTFLMIPFVVHPRGQLRNQPKETGESFNGTVPSVEQVGGGGKEFTDVGGPGAGSDLVQPSPVKYAGSTKHYEESLFEMTEEGLFSVELLVKGEHTVDIIIHDSQDMDVEGGVVEAFMWTPGEGALESEKLLVSEIRGGRYRVRKIAPRDGNWGIFFRIRKEGTVRVDDLVDSVVFELTGTGN